MLAKLKGNIVANFLYLVLFYIAYFLMLPVTKYTVALIGSIDILAPYYLAIPSSTTSFMDFILYVVLPVCALIWTIYSSTQPTYAQPGY
jgi:hypothetical protein